MRKANNKDLINNMYRNEATNVINMTDTILNLKPTTRMAINGLQIEVHPNNIYIGVLNTIVDIAKGNSRCNESAIFSTNHEPKLMIARYLVSVNKSDVINKDRLMCIVNEQISDIKDVLVV